LSGEVGTVLGDTLAKEFASAQTGIRKAIEAGATSSDGAQARTILALGSLRIAPEHLPELQQRIMDIAKELGCTKPDSERQFYRYLVAIYPSSEENSA
jgi:hypothetical protein